MNHANGPLLTLDVTEREASEENIDEVLEAYIGGRGVATKLAHDRIPFDADPFGPENRVYVSTGPLQQSQMSFTGRMNATGLSPLTDGLLSTNAGGYLSRNFVGSGYNCVEVVGKSDELLAIHVTDEGVEFEEVPELEESTAPEVTEYMSDNHGHEAEHILCIGPGGENLVRFASIMTYESRAFGRGGLGAVLGSKNVKAITFEGDSAPPVDLPEDIQMEVHRDAATSDDLFKRQGTTGGTEFINDEFSLPTRYFNEYRFEDIENIGGNAVEEKKYKKGACSACAFACKLPTRDEETGLETEGPEFETVYSFGAVQGIGDIVDIMKSNELCDNYGLDTISCGVTIAAYLDAHDEFGNADLVHELIEKIAYREGEGDMLAEGTHRIHDELGVVDYTVKGLEFAAHDGRTINGQGLAYATANRGADHMYSVMLRDEYDGKFPREGTEDKAERIVELENYGAFRDSGVICAFAKAGKGYVTHETFERLFEADYEEFLKMGSRVVEMERHFNNKRGMDRDDDQLPYEIPGFEDGLEEYYELRNWNDDGTVPESHFDEAAPADD